MTIKFPDVSQYTPNVDPAQYPIVIARATLSDRVADPTYATFKAKAAAAGTFFAAYHWLNHGNLKAQAAWCYKHVGPGVPVMIDAEDKAGNTGYNGPLTVADLTGFATEYRALGGTVTLAYLPFWYWSGAMSAPDLRPLAAAGLNLVSSNYPNAGYTEAGPGWSSYGGLAPVQWQFTSTPIDMNAFRGTVDEFIQIAGGTMSAHTDALIEGWNSGDEKLPDGTPNLIAVRWNRMERRVADLGPALAALAGPAVDTHALATDIADQLVAANTNGLSAADLDAVHGVVKAVLDGATIHTG